MSLDDSALIAAVSAETAATTKFEADVTNVLADFKAQIAALSAQLASGSPIQQSDLDALTEKLTLDTQNLGVADSAAVAADPGPVAAPSASEPAAAPAAEPPAQ